jgi:site-specific DNA recombinase
MTVLLSRVYVMTVYTKECTVPQTIEIQREFARKYCELHEIPIADYYADDGCSGTIALGDRPAGRRLLADAAEKRFDTVLLYRLDRIGRDPRLILNAVHEIESLGIQVRSMNEPFDSTTPAGRFMLTTLSGMAGYDRETILERMAAGTDRVIREGAWWGITPYGYQRVGEKRHARLVIADTPLPGLSLSEADVIRMIYKLSADEKQSCRDIARHLNRLGIPPGAQLGHDLGKRRRKTAGVWHPGRVRNMLVSTTYKGLHRYGIHTKKARGIIERDVPAIVDAELWQRAQETLRNNAIWSPRNSRRDYLLRGLLRCNLCGHTCVGSAHYGCRRYYICGGKGATSAAALGAKCPSRPVPADLEGIIWQDIEGFLRDPGPVLEEVATQMEDTGGRVAAIRKEAESAARALSTKDRERDAVLALFRKGLDRQLEEVERERAGLQEALKDAEERLRAEEQASEHLRSAEDLLRGLNARLDAPLTFELKRELVELLVDTITANTVFEDGKRDLIVEVAYRFTAPPNGVESRSSIATSRDRRAAPRSSSRVRRGVTGTAAREQPACPSAAVAAKARDAAGDQRRVHGVEHATERLPDQTPRLRESGPPPLAPGLEPVVGDLLAGERVDPDVPGPAPLVALEAGERRRREAPARPRLLVGLEKRGLGRGEPGIHDAFRENPAIATRRGDEKVVDDPRVTAKGNGAGLEVEIGGGEVARAGRPIHRVHRPREYGPDGSRSKHAGADGAGEGRTA